MRLTFLTQYFSPEWGAAPTRLFELTRRLAAMGHQVQVITAMPSYPLGRTFDGYRGRLRMVEEIEGVRVIRTWAYPSKSSRPIPRLLGYLSFMLSSVLLGCWGLGRQDVVVCNSPPLFVVPAGLAIARIVRGRFVLYVADLWPEVAVRLGYSMGRFSLEALRLLERFSYKWSDAVVTNSPGSRENISRRFPQVRTTILSNGADMEAFRPSLRSPEARADLGAGADDFLVGYFGLYGLFQGLEVIVEAAAKLRGHPRIKFVMVGDGPRRESLMELAGRRRLDNLKFGESVSKERVPAMLASCDVSLVPLAVKFPATVPLKTYEALACGVPVVISRGSEGENLVSRHNVGRAFSPLDADELAAVLSDLADDPREWAQLRENCLNLAKRFDWSHIARQAEATLQAVADGRPLPEVKT